jgi:small subunit ribosomal protein S16
VAVKIRLKRMGKIRAPYYRIVVADARKKRDGRVIEEIGKYHPKEEPSVIEVQSERAQYWLGVGAQPSEAVAAILKLTGDWQKYRGEPGSESSVRFAEPKPSKTDLFNEALKESSIHAQGEAVTRRSPKKATEDAPVEKPAAVEAAAPAAAEAAQETPASDVPAANATPGDETPEGAAEQAVAAEAPAVDAEATSSDDSAPEA